MEALVYGAEKVSSTKRRQFQVCLSRAWQAATTWSDADHQKAIEWLEREIHQVTPAQGKVFDKLFQRHERPLLQDVGTKATGPRSRFTKLLPLMKTAAKVKAWGAANMTADKRLQCQNCLSDAETEAATSSLADTERVTLQLERDIYGITWNEQKRFKKEFSIRMTEFEAWWETIGIQVLQNAIELCVIHSGYPKMHHVSDISDSIRRMGSGDHFTTDILERLHIANVKDAYRSINKVNYIRQMLKHNDYMEETLSYLALEGWYDVDSAKVFKQLSATNTRQSTCRAHLLRLQSIRDELFIHPVTQQVYHLRETHVCGVCRSIKFTSPRDASEHFGIPNFGQLFHAKFE